MKGRLTSTVGPGGAHFGLNEFLISFACCPSVPSLWKFSPHLPSSGFLEMPIFHDSLMEHILFGEVLGEAFQDSVRKGFPVMCDGAPDGSAFLTA